MADATEEIIQKHEKQLKTLEGRMDRMQELMAKNFEQSAVRFEEVSNWISQLDLQIQTINEGMTQKILKAFEVFQRSEKGKTATTELQFGVATNCYSTTSIPAAAVKQTFKPPPTPPNQYSVPFSGGDPCEFIRGYEEFFKVNPMTEVDMIQYMMQDFEGEALEWYYEYVEENFLDTWTPNCWEDFVAAIYRRFHSLKVEHQVWVERPKTKSFEHSNSKVVHNVFVEMLEQTSDTDQILGHKTLVISEINHEFKLLQARVEYVNFHQVLRYDLDSWSYWLSIGLNFDFDPGEFFDMIIMEGQYSEREVTKLLKTIIWVVESCYPLGVMHRDLKPENFLFKNTDGDALKTTDFGLSMFYKPGETFCDVVGSPYYVAPEVLQKHYEPESDVWSTRVILYILLSGIPPSWAETEMGTFKQILQEKLDFESEPWPGISDSAKDLICKMLDRNPKKRLNAHEQIDTAISTSLKESNIPVVTVGDAFKLIQTIRASKKISSNSFSLVSPKM